MHKRDFIILNQYDTDTPILIQILISYMPSYLIVLW
jgi:hypothetical protein